jgi:hypothetical protein
VLPGLTHAPLLRRGRARSEVPDDGAGGRMSRTLSSPVGATPSQLLGEFVGLLDEGVFIHLRMARPDSPVGAPVVR